MPRPRTPEVAVDLVIELEDRPGRPIVLIRRGHPPPGHALPGGFVDIGETVEHAAMSRGARGNRPRREARRIAGRLFRPGARPARPLGGDRLRRDGLAASRWPATTPLAILVTDPAEPRRRSLSTTAASSATTSRGAGPRAAKIGRMSDTPALRFLRLDDGEFDSAPGQAINSRYLADEKTVVSELLALARLPDAEREAIRRDAIALVVAARSRREGKTGIESFLQQYGLASQEGVVLMCLAEALLRIPDADTADKLIADKIAIGQWSDYLGEADSLFVNASTWGLMLTGKLVRESELEVRDPVSFLRRLVARLGEPVVRTAFRHAMRIMGRQFVMGRDIGEALERAASEEGARYRHTYDMLGESALTEPDARAISRPIAPRSRRSAARCARAASPRAGRASRSSSRPCTRAMNTRGKDAVRAELGPRLESLALAAKSAGIALTVDAEEAERLEISLLLIDGLLDSPALAGWDGLGLAVQAYSKRAPDVIRYLQRRADATGRVLNLRLVKGAYWDSEVKRAQERGLPGYPVYTRKANTDIAYLACARLLLEGSARVYPQFATHNAHTAASIIHLAKARGRAFEFQRLHGMGEELYAELTDPAGRALPCRVYAPVGSHEELLPYLVRRLLENGANTSFVNRIVDESLPVEEVVGDPVADVERAGSGPHPRIPRTAQPLRRGAQRTRPASTCPTAASSGGSPAPAARRLQRRSARAPIVGGPGRGGRAPGLPLARGPRPRDRRGG